MTKTTEDDGATKQKVVEQEKKIAQLNYLLSERETQIAELTQLLEQLQQSPSWKFSYPLRYLENQFVRLKALYRTFKRTIGFGGGFVSTIKKIIRIFQQEGFGGIMMRARHIKKHHEPLAPKHPSHLGLNLSKYHLSDANKNQNENYLAQIRALDLTAYDVISLDVFDTALVRHFASPDGIFNYIEEHHQLAGFKKKRLQAEANARTQHPEKKDIDLATIYAQPALADIDPQPEMDAELLFCVANPVIYDLYLRAQILKKSVYFVSDMYLSQAHIEQLLAKQGYHDYEQLYVSSEDDLIKGDGSRFQTLKKEWEDKKVLHIGDNYLADYEWPKKLQFDAEHYCPPDQFYQQDTLVGSLYEGIKQVQSAGLSFALGSYRRWKLGDKSPEGWGLWRDLGFLFGGPLLYLFTQYVHQQNQQRQGQQPTQLCFLARDGLIIKKVYDLLFKPDNQESIYLLASRRAMTFPLWSMDLDACKKTKLLDIYFSTHSASNAAEVVERLGYDDLDDLLQDLEHFQQQQKDSIIANEKDLKALIYQHHTTLQAKAKEELNGLMAYLDESQVLDPNKQSIVVDVGWVGTIQDSLNEVMAATQTNKHFDGLYMGVLPIAAQPESKGGFLFNPTDQELFASLSPFRNFIELLTAAPVPGLVRFSPEAPYAIFDETPSEQEQHRLFIAEEIQHGIMDFAHTVKQLGVENIPELLPSDLNFLFELLQRQASPAVIAALSQTKHARLPSSAFTHSVIEF